MKIFIATMLVLLISTGVGAEPLTWHDEAGYLKGSDGLRTPAVGLCTSAKKVVDIPSLDAKVHIGSLCFALAGGINGTEPIIGIGLAKIASPTGLNVGVGLFYDNTNRKPYFGISANLSDLAKRATAFIKNVTPSKDMFKGVLSEN